MNVSKIGICGDKMEAMYHHVNCGGFRLVKK